MNRRWTDGMGRHRVAREDRIGYTFAQFDRDFAAQLATIPAPVDPGFSEVEPRDFIRPDGSYGASELNVGERSHVDAVNDFKRRLRDATPITPDTEAAQ